LRKIEEDRGRSRKQINLKIPNYSNPKNLFRVFLGKKRTKVKAELCIQFKTIHTFFHYLVI